MDGSTNMDASFSSRVDSTTITRPKRLNAEGLLPHAPAMNADRHKTMVISSGSSIAAGGTRDYGQQVADLLGPLLQLKEMSREDLIAEASRRISQHFELEVARQIDRASRAAAATATATASNGSANGGGDENVHVLQKTVRSMSDQMYAVVQHAQATEGRHLNELSVLRAENANFLREREDLYDHLEQRERAHEQVVQMNQHQRRTVIELSQKLKEAQEELDEKQKVYDQLQQRFLGLRTDAERQLALANDAIEQTRREEQQAGQTIRLRLTAAESRSTTLEKQNELLRDANAELTKVCNELLANAEADNDDE